MNLTIAEKAVMLKLLRSSTSYRNGDFIATTLVEKLEASVHAEVEPIRSDVCAELLKMCLRIYLSENQPDNYPAEWMPELKALILKAEGK